MKAALLNSFLAFLAIAVTSRPQAREIQLNGHTFTVPEGFEIQRIAGPPLVDRPIVADFDEQGRLYVADSSGSNASVQEQLETKPHRIVRLEDTDHDGTFDKSTVFADRMMFPEGAMWFNGSLYVSAPPSIWKLTDTDGDGSADLREEWFKGKTLTGCANDLHGPYRGPDGWIYWCKGAFAQQEYNRPDGSQLITRAAHIFRQHPAGGLIEPVMTGGMDNPVDLAFTPGGERIFTTTFFQHPGGGKRDGLVHAIYGGVYGKSHNVIDGHPRTGDLMPVLTHLGPAAPCGLTRVESDAFGPGYQNNLFACLFNLHKVTRHILEPAGSTFQTTDSDFLVSDQVDFHPTDVIEDADGSLVVVDTGGWYKLCCPTSQLYKPDVLGAIYRVRRTGAPRLEDPRGRTLPWPGLSSEQLAQLLGDARPAVRRMATERLAALGAQAIGPLSGTLENNTDPNARLNAVWTLTRIETQDARHAVHRALSDPEPSVQLAALNSIALHRDASALPRLTQTPQDAPPAIRRQVAAAIGRIGDREGIEWLAKAAHASNDRPAEHAIIYALIEIGDPERTRELLTGESQRAALIALDQMRPGALRASDVLDLLTSASDQVRNAAEWVSSHHPEWGEELSGYFKRQLGKAASVSDGDNALQQQLISFANNSSIQQLIADRLISPETPPSVRRLLLQVMQRSGLAELPQAWRGAVQSSLTETEADLILHAIRVIRSLPLPKTDPSLFDDPLRRLALDRHQEPPVRLAAAACRTGLRLTLPDEFFQLLIDQLDSSHPVGQRGDAAQAMIQASLTAPQQLALAARLTSLGPLELSRLLPAFEEGSSDELGLALIAALENAVSFRSLRQDQLTLLLGKYSPRIQAEGNRLFDRLDISPARQKARLAELLPTLSEGDIRRGQTVFNSSKAACASCHAIGYLGGTVGPDLTRIGQIRSERDLLEAIVYPSASFVRSYEPLIVETKSDEEYSGVVRRDAPDALVLATGPDTEVRIERTEITEMRPGSLSVMPTGMDEVLSRQELADLVAFLRATRWR